LVNPPFNVDEIDVTELPGMPPTTGYLSLEKFGIQKIGELLIKKLGK